MKKFLVLAVFLCCTSTLFAYVEPTFGVGGAFFKHGITATYENGYSYDASDDVGLANQFGVTVGIDIVGSVWETSVGNLYMGSDIAFEYWVPTKHEHGAKAIHVMRVPLQGYISYEFNVNGGSLKAVGPYFSAGMGLNFVSTEEKFFGKDPDVFKPSFRWGVGVNLAFSSNWAIKTGVGGDAGSGQKTDVYDGDEYYEVSWNWVRNTFFMFELGYRF
jgi:opacity protein-like surface antigen